ncbi:MAG: hypothetical protein GC181_16460 [Bacteroidetes bacterium]|nr:hypothetical protein [Bacteroidota bacterium]
MTLTLVWGVLATAQNATLAKDLADINYAYYSLNRKMSVTSTTTSESGTQVQKYTASMKTMDEFYMQSGSTELLVRSGVKVVMNKEMQSIMIDSNAVSTIGDLPLQMFDTLATLYTHVVHKILGGGVERYEMNTVVSDKQKIIVEFNRNTKLLTMLQVVVKDDAGKTITSMTVQYQYTALQSGDIPPVSKYIRMDSQGIAQLAPNYSKFQLINFLNR